jgi:protein-disulfide isomerase
MKLNKELKILAIVAIVVVIASVGIYQLISTEKKPTSDVALNLSTGISNFSEGSQDSKVTVVEFFDPECETCAEVSPYIKNEMKFYNGKVRWVFRYMAYHPSSSIAIHILEAARNQNLYFEAMALLFEKQHIWGAKHGGNEPSLPKEKELLEIISGLPGINFKKLQEDMKNPEIDKLIEKDKLDGTNAGVNGTPTLFVNNKIVMPLSLDKMIEGIEAGLK